MRTVAAIPTSGAGSWPGVDIDESVRQVADLVSIPYLPELPARGPGSDMVGRTLGQIEGIGFDLSPTGWQVTPTPGSGQRRARARLRDDLDVLAERLEGYEGPYKIALCGPWTLAAAVDLPRGGRVLRDPGAVRDLVAAALVAAESMVAEVERRLPAASIVLQIDEPGLPGVLSGGIPTESGLRRYAPVDPELVSSTFRRLGKDVVVHSCAPAVPIDLLRDSGIGSISVDGDLVDRAGWDAITALVDGGGTLWLGGLPTSTTAIGSVDAVVRRTLSWLRPLELGPSLVGHLVLTPACGLSHLTSRQAVDATRVVDRASDLIAEELLH